MNTLNPLAPAKKYTITYVHRHQRRTVYADVVHWNEASGVLTMDGVTTMIFNPKTLTISLTDAVIFR